MRKLADFFAENRQFLSFHGLFTDFFVLFACFLTFVFVQYNGTRLWLGLYPGNFCFAAFRALTCPLKHVINVTKFTTSAFREG